MKKYLLFLALILILGFAQLSSEITIKNGSLQLITKNKRIEGTTYKFDLYVKLMDLDKIYFMGGQFVVSTPLELGRPEFTLNLSDIPNLKSNFHHSGFNPNIIDKTNSYQTILGFLPLDKFRYKVYGPGEYEGINYDEDYIRNRDLYLPIFLKNQEVMIATVEIANVTNQELILDIRLLKDDSERQKGGFTIMTHSIRDERYWSVNSMHLDLIDQEQQPLIISTSVEELKGVSLSQIDNTIKIDNPESKELQVSITDISGKVLIEKSITTSDAVNISEFANGAYIISCTNEGRQKILKFVK